MGDEMTKNLNQKQALTAVNNGNKVVRSLEDQSRYELIQLARDLSKGCYEKESKQRKQILQMIADKLAEKPGSPP
jgi:hypothetical protein